MRSLLLAALLLAPLPTLLSAADALQVVNPVLSRSDDGVNEPAGTQHIGGETLFFSCRIAHYAKTPELRVSLSYSVQAFDPKGVPLTEIYKNELMTEVAPQDKEWLPKIVTEIQIPPLVGPGTYKVLVKAEDLYAKTSTELAVEFAVRARDVAPSATLVVRNFQYMRGEEDTQPLEKPVYKPGDPLWLRFDIIGFQYGPGNKIDVSYSASLLSPSGKVLWTQPEPAVERSESFYPKRYVAAQMGLNLLPSTRPGDYTMVIAVKDAVGGQSFEGKFPFTVQ